MSQWRFRTQYNAHLYELAKKTEIRMLEVGKTQMEDVISVKTQIEIQIIDRNRESKKSIQKQLDQKVENKGVVKGCSHHRTRTHDTSEWYTREKKSNKSENIKKNQ